MYIGILIALTIYGTLLFFCNLENLWDSQDLKNKKTITRMLALLVAMIGFFGTTGWFLEAFHIIP